MKKFDMYVASCVKEKDFSNDTPLILDDSMLLSLKNSIK